MTAQARRPPFRDRVSGLFAPGSLVLLAAAIFVAISTWWALYDQRPPSGDVSRHLEASQLFGRSISEGDLLAPFRFSDAFAYPPLVRLIAGLPEVVGLPSGDWGPVALNLVFVPLLAWGCFLVGRRVFSPAAGVLAAVFALGSPMVMQLFHVELLDAPLAAMTAVTVAALLASDDFRRPRESALAGLLLGLGMLVKSPAPIFVAGVIAVMLVRGGWRNPRNLALAAAATLLVAAPFYLTHAGAYLSLSGEAVVESTDAYTQEFGWTFDGSRRFAFESFTWYVWAAVNTQYLVPLLSFFAVGLIVSVARFRRQRYVPELLAGLTVGYAVMTLLSLHDPRYTLPLVVYIAVIATGWIPFLRSTRLSALATVLLIAVVGVNFAAGTFGLVSTLKIRPFPGDKSEDLIHPGAFTVVDDRGYYVAGPRADDTWDDLFAAIAAEDVDPVQRRPYEILLFGVEGYGLSLLARENDVPLLFTDLEAAADSSEARPQVVIKTWWSDDPYFAEPGDLGRPCFSVEDGIAPPSSDSRLLHVLIERDTGQRFVRWCGPARRL